MLFACECIWGWRTCPPFCVNLLFRVVNNAWKLMGCLDQCRDPQGRLVRWATSIRILTAAKKKIGLQTKPPDSNLQRGHSQKIRHTVHDLIFNTVGLNIPPLARWAWTPCRGPSRRWSGHCPGRPAEPRGTARAAESPGAGRGRPRETHYPPPASPPLGWTERGWGLDWHCMRTYNQK